MEETKKEYRVVGYTDGGARPSRGCWGSGYFGYIYDINSVGSVTKSLPKNVRPTTHGFTCPELYQESPDFYKDAKDVQPCNYIVGSIPGWDVNTNNFAEAYALLYFVKKVKSIEDKDIKHLLIFMDSQMLIFVTQDLLNNPSPNFSKYAFPDLYLELFKDLTELMNKGTKIVVKHVYGHKFSFGNIISDRLAFMGRTCCEDILLRNIVEFKYRYEEIIECNPERDSFWSSQNLSDYILGRNVYFKSDHVRGSYPYYIWDYKGDDEPGDKNGNILMGSIYPSKGDDILENIIEKHLTIRPDNGIVFTGEIPKIKDPLTTFFQSVSNYYCFTKDTRPTHLTTVEEFTVCRTLRPGCLAVQLLNRFDVHPIILAEYEKYLKGEKIDDIFTIIDLTEQFYTKTEKKGKIKYECKLSPKETAIVLSYNGKDYPFAFRVDIPDRNYLKRLEKSLDIKAAMVFRQTGDATADYFFFLYIVTPEEEVVKSIWNNDFSNKIFLELNNKK